MVSDNVPVHKFHSDVYFSLSVILYLLLLTFLAACVFYLLPCLRHLSILGVSSACVPPLHNPLNLMSQLSPIAVGGKALSCGKYRHHTLHEVLNAKDTDRSCSAGKEERSTNSRTEYTTLLLQGTIIWIFFLQDAVCSYFSKKYERIKALIG